MSKDTNQKRLHQSQELGAFLQARRRRLTPEQAGLAPGERRRVDGLRREEVAALAGIGTTWYTWLEQGRDIHVSNTVLDNLAQALQLSTDERTYMLALGGYEHSLPVAVQEKSVLPEVPPLVQKLLDKLDPHPAHLRDHHWDILAWNHSELQFYPWETLAGKERNLLLHIFTHPHPRYALLHWEEYVRNKLGLFRMAWSQYPEDHRFSEVIILLQQVSSEFRRWWAEYNVQQQPFNCIEWLLPDGRTQTFFPLYLTLGSYPPLTIRVLL